MTHVLRPIIEAHILEGLCKTIAETNDGLTGSEIEYLINNSGLVDTSPHITKWKRLFNSFVDFQNRKQCSNNILIFIQKSMGLGRYIGKEELFHNRRTAINKYLSLAGFELIETGKFKIVPKASTITEAEGRAGRLKHKLESRNVHPEIFNYCKAELLVDNYFHSVFEATKSVADRLRKMTGLYADGNALAETAFSTNNPLIKINLLTTDTDRSEHIGLCNLIKGIFGLIRNSTAHEPKIKFVVTEEEALDVLGTISYIHKKLDKSH